MTWHPAPPGTDPHTGPGKLVPGEDDTTESPTAAGLHWCGRPERHRPHGQADRPGKCTRCNGFGYWAGPGIFDACTAGPRGRT